MKTLLLAETHPPTLAHLQDALKLAGHAVRAVTDPGAALELVIAEPPDAVVVALDFPRLDGQHLARKIRETERGARIPLLVVDKAHLGRARGVAEVLDLRADAYVANPIQGPELGQKLQALLAAPQEPPSTGIARTLSRPAVASGELKSRPLPGLLHSSYRLKRSGILVLVSRELVRRLFLREGAVAGFDSTARQDGFVPFLLERGHLSAAQAEQVEAASTAGMRIAAALEEAGVTLEGDALLQHWRGFVRERAAQMVGMHEGRFAFYPGDEFFPEVISVDIPALAPILDGTRRTSPIRLFAQTLKPHLSEFPQRTETFGADLPTLGLDTDDLKVAMQMNGRLALRELLTRGRGDLRRTSSLAWFLQLTQTIAFAREPVAEGANRGPETLAPRKLKSLPAETAHELREAAVRILASSYFGVLGVPITAEADEVERAYREIAPRFHADSYPENDVTELQDLLDSVQEKITAAYRVLSQPEKRKGYLQHLLSRLELPRATPVNVEAELAIKRGEAALKRKDARSAVVAFERALELNPREPEYYAYLAWANYLGGNGARDDRAKAAQKVLRKALALNPYLERAQVLSAVIDAETGDPTSARKKLLKVLELNPASRVAKAALRKVNR